MERKVDQRFLVAKKIIETLEEHGFEAMFAGGCVRDRILRREPKDYDIATDALPTQVIDVARGHRMKCIPTGIDHGTVTIVLNSIPVEVTTLRADKDTDGRHATVEFGASFEEDASRRDFTVNAMYEDAQGKIYDFHDGQADLKAGVLKFVGDPEKRITEDYLRVLRLFRFWGELDLTPSDETLHILAKHLGGLKKLSQERVWSELEKTLQSAPQKVLEKMADLGVFSQFIAPGKKLRSESFENLESSVDLPGPVLAIFRLALIAWREKLAAKEIQANLKLSNKQSQLLGALLAVPDRIDAAASGVAESLLFARDWFRQCPEVSFQTALQFAAACRASDLSFMAKVKSVETNEKNHAARLAGMPLSGDQIMADLGIGPGKELGDILKLLDRGYLEGAWATSREGLAIARKIIPNKPK